MQICSFSTSDWLGRQKGCIAMHSRICVKNRPHTVGLLLASLETKPDRFPQTETHTHTHRHTDTQTHRHTDTQTHRHTDTQTHRHTDTQTHRHTQTLAHTHTDTDTDTDTNTDTDTDTHTQGKESPPTLREPCCSCTIYIYILCACVS